MSESGGSGHRDTAAERDRAALRAVFNETPVPQVLLRADGTIRRINQAAAALLGVATSYAAGRGFGLFLAAEQRAALGDHLVSVLAGRRAASFDSLLRDGTRSRPISLTLTPIAPAGDPDVQVLLTLTGSRLGQSATPVVSTEQAGPGDVQQVERLHRMVSALVHALVTTGSADPQTRVRAVSAAFDAWALLDAEASGSRRRLAVCAPDPAFGAHVRALTDLAPGVGDVDVVGEVFASGDPVLITQLEDTAALGHFPDGRAVLDVLEGSSLLAVPGVDVDGRVARVMTLVRRPDRPAFTLADLGLVQRMSGLATEFVEIGTVLAAERQLREALLNALQPRRLGPVPGWEISTLMARQDRPSLAVGHLFAARELPGGAALVLGRAVGEGAPAAAAALAVQQGAQALLAAEVPPEQVFRVLEGLLDDHPGVVVHLLLAMLNNRSDGADVTLFAAGDGGLYLARAAGEVVRWELDATPPLGAAPERTDASAQLRQRAERGDVLALIADSTMTSVDGCGEPFADTLAPRALAHHAGEPADQVLDALVRAHTAACPDGPPPAALTARRTG